MMDLEALPSSITVRLSITAFGIIVGSELEVPNGISDLGDKIQGTGISDKKDYREKEYQDFNFKGHFILASLELSSFSVHSIKESRSDSSCRDLPDAAEGEPGDMVGNLFNMGWVKALRAKSRNDMSPNMMV